MTWTKKGAEFTDECARAALSDAAYRTHDEAIAWLYLVEATDCRIPKRLMPRIAVSLDWELAVKELVTLRFWRDRGEFWEVVHHADVIRQSIAAQRNKRSGDAKRQREHRRKKARNVTRDITRDVAATQTDSQTQEGGGAGGAEIRPFPQPDSEGKTETER